MKKLDFLTRGQIQSIHKLKSDRNAQRVLKQMEEYLNVIRSGENIYYLNAAGRSLVNCDKVRKSTGNVQHYIMRNYLYIAYSCPQSWDNEIRITSEGKSKKDTVTCVADAVFKRGDFYTVIEVDNTQTMKKNQVKIQKYRTLKDRFTFGPVAPKFVWITTTENRRKELIKLNEDKGLVAEVFTLTDFNA
ncbi:replication-relaxation family protein (plasmid) [Neobacillus sp. SCS-31]|uniref:replication-relaxation family protein n=1 Tax=Neobacillus oceani TaxID=3115292 RepID=UPI0039063855